MFCSMILINIVVCSSDTAMINDDFLEEVSNINNYNLHNCPPEWWDRGFVMSKQSKRTFLFKIPTKNFKEVNDRLKEYGELFKYRRIRFSYLNEEENDILLNSIVNKNPGSRSKKLQPQDYAFTRVPSAALKTTFFNEFEKKILNKVKTNLKNDSYFYPQDHESNFSIFLNDTKKIELDDLNNNNCDNTSFNNLIIII